MSYKLQTQKIIPGGLNFLAPGDQTAEGDCLDLSGWWSAAIGKLEQAPTFSLASIPTVMTPQDSLCQADGRLYYGGEGNLRQIGRNGEAPIDRDYDGTPLGMLSYQGFCWIMNRAKQRKDDGTTVTDWTPAPPAAAPTLEDLGHDGAGASPAVGNPPESGAAVAEQYAFYYTWQIAGVGETGPAPLGNITPAAGSIIRIWQGSTPPANATGWNIYVKTPALATPYRLNEFTLDLTRLYVDYYGDDVHTHSDAQLLSLGIILSFDNGNAPPARVIANQTYNGRMVVANSDEHPSRIWFSPALQPAFFRGADNPNDGDWVDIGTDKGDEILAMIVHPTMLVIYRSKSIWRHVGDFNAPSARIEPAVADMGTVGVRGVVSTSLGDYFIWQDGVYKFNGDWAQKLSAKVEPVFRGRPTDNLATLNTANRARCAIGSKNGRIWVSYPWGDGAGAASLIYHVDTQRWFNDPLGYRVFLDTGTEFFGAGQGVYSLEKSYGGGEILAYQSEYQDCGLPDHEKTWGDLVINHNTQGQTLTITIRTNKGADPLTDTFVLATINSTQMGKQVIPLLYPVGYPVIPNWLLPVRSYSLSVRITGNGGTTPVTIDTPILLHYYLESRKGKTFDTGITSHGLDGVGTIDEVELDIDTSDGLAFPQGATKLHIEADIPLGMMTRQTGTGVPVPRTIGRQVLRLVLPTPIDGRRFRHRIFSDYTFQVYGYRVKMLPIGVYLDGSQLETWQTGAIATGV
jgi:hypothetical protein